MSVKMPTELVVDTKYGSIRYPDVDSSWIASAFGPMRFVRHACERCAFVRRVKFTFYMRQGVEIGGRVGSMWCEACRYEVNALKYQRLADQNRHRAVKARSQQAMKRLGQLNTKG